MQAEPPGQTVPQDPQLRLLVSRFTQALPHRVRPDAQVRGWHTPAVQTELPAQTRPHRPQLRGSVWVFVHEVPHTTWPVPQEHWPLTQLPPSEHCMLQPPQLSTSLDVFTQALLQFVSPATQPEVHMPREHTGAVAGHTLPQAPQLRGSLWLAVHTPPLQRIP